MNLLSVQGEGFAYVLLIFLMCAAIVHGVRLAMLGYRSVRKKTAHPRKKPAPKPEPVYYIVERKKKRPKSEYSDPRRITFKDQTPSD